MLKRFFNADVGPLIGRTGHEPAGTGYVRRMHVQRPIGESVIVLTGESNGIGVATAYELASRGTAAVLAAAPVRRRTRAGR